MIDLERIKTRRAATPPYWGSGTLRVSDVDALIAEVERLEGENNLMGEMLIARGCDEPIAEVVRLGDQIEELEAEVEKIPFDIRRRTALHVDTWSGRLDCYWFYRLCQEVGELGSSLAEDHEHSPEYEIAQIASICINWLIRKERKNEE